MATEHNTPEETAAEGDRARDYLRQYDIGRGRGEDLAADRFAVACALYWYCADYHGGQWSEEYRILSGLEYRPGAIERGPEVDSVDAMIYADLAAGAIGAGELWAWLQATE